MPRLPSAQLIALVLVALALVLLWHGSTRRRPTAVVASPTATPGAVLRDVTQATIHATICVPGWTRTIRPPSSYTSDLKRRQMRLYGLRGPPGDYQEDHLISLELGGHPTDPRNLWPEPNPRARQVDRIENELNDRVCSGELELREAQRLESTLKHREG